MNHRLSTPAAPCALAITTAALVLAIADLASADPAPAQPPPTEQPPAAPAPAAPADPPLPPAPATAAATPLELPPLFVGAWGRLAIITQGANGSRINDLTENGEADLLFGGKIQKYFAIAANLIATFGPTSATTGEVTGSVSIMDLIAQMDFTDAFHVWVGRMLVPADRSNLSGSWFIAPWSYPGQFLPFAPPIGPREGPAGRNDGITVWGQIQGGKLKYYLGAYDLFASGESPLINGRINLALLDPEPGYLHSSSYYGKNMLTFGLGGQFKRNGSVGATSATNYGELNADVLYEHPFPDRGVLDLEGAFYGYFGDNEPIDTSFFVLASYLLPDQIGIGRLQPLVRFQGASPASGNLFRILELQVGYIVKPYAARLALVYQRTDVATQSSNAIILGVQLQK